MGAVDLGGSKKPSGGGPSWKRPRVSIRVDMTPMVDIAFLLLIFFMVTTVFRAPQTMEMALPEKDKEEKPKEQIKVDETKLLTFFVVRIDDKDSIAYMVGTKSPKPLPWKELGDTLLVRRALAGFSIRQPDSARIDSLIVLAKIDPKASYESLVSIVDQFNVDSITRFSIDKYNTLDDSILKVAGFTTGDPKGLPAPPEVEED
jgi:biopolymer transport protein ExbD